MNRTQAADVLRRTGWLSATPGDFRDEVLARCDLLHFAPRESLFAAGDDTGGLFGVAAGSVSVFMPAPAGEMDLGHIGGPGFWTGEFAAVTGARRRVSVSARSDCRVMRLPRASLQAIAQRQPATWSHVTTLLAENLHLALNVIDALKRDDPAERMGRVLLNLVGDVTGPAKIMARQSELAAIAHLSRTTVNAVMADLERRGWVRQGYGVVEVIDLPALESFVQGA